MILIIKLSEFRTNQAINVFWPEIWLFLIGDGRLSNLMWPFTFFF